MVALHHGRDDGRKIIRQADICDIRFAQSMAEQLTSVDTVDHMHPVTALRVAINEGDKLFLTVTRFRMDHPIELIVDSVDLGPRLDVSSVDGGTGAAAHLIACKTREETQDDITIPNKAHLALGNLDHLFTLLQRPDKLARLGRRSKQDNAQRTVHRPLPLVQTQM